MTNCDTGINIFCFLFPVPLHIQTFSVTSSSYILTDSNVYNAEYTTVYVQVHLRAFQDFFLHDEYRVFYFGSVNSHLSTFLAVYLFKCVYIWRGSNYLYFLCTFYSTLGLWWIYKKTHQDEYIHTESEYKFYVLSHI